MYELLTRLWTNEEGATAIELGFIAAPFLAIVFTILNFALLLIQTVSLTVATAALATQIRTGQYEAPGIAATNSSGKQLDLADAKTALCAQMALLTNCTAQLQLDVRPLSSFMQTAATSPISGNQFNASNFCYYSGDAGDIVEVRAYYLFPIIVPLLAWLSPVTSYTTASGTTSGNFFPIVTAQVFRSENYQSASNTGAGC